MNYTETYKALRSYGVPGDEARSLLDRAEMTGPAKLGTITVSFSTFDGFQLAKEES